MTDQLLSDRFPRSAKYNPEWISVNGMGSNPLWLAEWVAAGMELKPGMRVLDLGCGRALSSIFLAREFGVQVWAADLWISAAENWRRICDAELQDRVFPIHADAHTLPFAGEFFDAITSLDSFPYYGTDSLYLNYLAHFLPPGGQIGIAGAGIVCELEVVPQHLREFWTQDLWALHSAHWWRQHWQRTGIVNIEVADNMPDGWKVWLDWHKAIHPQNTKEIVALEADRGANLCYVRLVARCNADVQFEPYCWPDTLRSFEFKYEHRPLLRKNDA